MDIQEKSEIELIEDLKEKINTKIIEIIIKVNKSALNYMAKEKKWIGETNLSEANTFFLEKIPIVLSTEITEEINQLLGLNENN